MTNNRQPMMADSKILCIFAVKLRETCLLKGKLEK